MFVCQEATGKLGKLVNPGRAMGLRGLPMAHVPIIVDWNSNVSITKLQAHTGMQGGGMQGGGIYAANTGNTSCRSQPCNEH